MCFPHPETQRPHDDMGFDISVLKSVLESFVEEMAEESKELVLERPRFATAVVVVADGADEICQATCIRQLDDITVMEIAESASVDEDESIQRALRELLESREMLGTVRDSICCESADDAYHSSDISKPLPIYRTSKHPMSNDATNQMLLEINRSAQLINKSTVQFPSMNRSRTNV